MSFTYYLARLVSRLKPRAIRSTTRHTTAKIGPGSQVVNCSIGRYSYCGQDCTILETNIGAFTSIADHVTIGGVKHNFNLIATSKVFQRGRNPFGKSIADFPAQPMVTTTIGNDVFIGKDSFVSAGVQIGTGAIVGMGSIVTKDVPPYAIVAGVPAKVIGHRFPEDTRKALLATGWWDLPDAKIRDVAQHFANPTELLRSLE